MCGIAGFVRRGATWEPARTRAVLGAMCDALRHRGPDDEGYLVEDWGGLGMTRLSIIDLNTGHQPISTPDGAMSIVYNGETYNYRELRDELRREGCCFATASDTEVVLQMYRRHGVSAFSRLNGMFALALWDREARKLILCRDPVGIKPLYYCCHGDSFVFASEIKALLRHPDVSKDLNPQALWDYLTHEYVPSPETLFKGVFKLLPGHYLEVSLADLGTNQVAYRDYPRRTLTPMALDEVQEEFERRLTASVRRQVVADVPVGVLLSGGLDSTAVACLACTRDQGITRTFTVGFEEPVLTDEMAQARETAKFLGTEHAEYRMDGEEYFGLIDEVVRLMDEPNADMAVVGKYVVNRLASRDVKVVLSGEGGDEVLGGYRMDEAMRRFDQLRRLQRLPAWLGRDLPAGLAAMLGLRGLEQRTRHAFIPLSERAQTMLPCMTRRFSEAEKHRLLGSTPPGVEDSMRMLRADFRRAVDLEPMSQMQYAWSKQWLAEHLLMQADRMSMAHSVELRVPLLDLELADFLLALPDAAKVRKVDGRYRTKYLLRRFLADKVPEAVLSRPKRGFQIPNLYFLRTSLRGRVKETLENPNACIHGLLDRDEVRRRSQALHAGASERDCQQAWILFILERWCQRWM